MPDHTISVTFVPRRSLNLRLRSDLECGGVLADHADLLDHTDGRGNTLPFGLTLQRDNEDARGASIRMRMPRAWNAGRA